MRNKTIKCGCAMSPVGPIYHSFRHVVTERELESLLQFLYQSQCTGSLHILHEADGNGANQATDSHNIQGQQGVDVLLQEDNAKSRSTILQDKRRIRRQQNQPVARGRAPGLGQFPRPGCPSRHQSCEQLWDTASPCRWE